MLTVFAALAIKHLTQLSVEQEYWCTIFCKTCTFHVKIGSKNKSEGTKNGQNKETKDPGKERANPVYGAIMKVLEW